MASGFPVDRPVRILVLCTHNSARSQMAEGWLRTLAGRAGLAVHVASAGIEATRVKPEAIEVMEEKGIDLAGHRSKTIEEVPDAGRFHLVWTVCDAAAERCPVFAGDALRLHVDVPDPTGSPLETWRAAREALGAMAARCVSALAEGRWPNEGELHEAMRDAPAP